MVVTPAAEENLVEEIEALGENMGVARAQIAKRFIGQDRVVELVLASLVSGGHALLIGLPGLGKTRLVDTLGTVMGLHDNRVQFTPDLMPADILGSEVLETATVGSRAFRFIEGPIFCQLLMADEINRASPRTQSALLQAMQEKLVTVAGQSRPLGKPFHVLATQNPIEQEGTYPLPEAQLDRFMFNVLVDYPDEEDELEIVRRTTTDHSAEVKATLTGEEIHQLAEVVRRVPIADHVARYALQLARSTRREKGSVPAFVKDYVSWGAGPRATQYLVLGGKARAILHGRYYVDVEDIRAVAPAVLRHRILTNFNAEAEGITPDTIVQKLIETVPVSHEVSTDGGHEEKIFRSADAL